MPVTAGNSPQKSTPAICASAGDLGPAEHHLHRVLDAARPFSVSSAEVEVEQQPGEHEEPEQRDYPAGPVKYAANSRRMRLASVAC